MAMDTDSKTTDLDIIGRALQRHFDFSRIPSGEYERKYYPNSRTYSFEQNEEDFVRSDLDLALSAYERIVKMSEPDWKLMYEGACEDRRILEHALESISKNTCCDKCQEAALVARKALSDAGF